MKKTKKQLEEEIERLRSVLKINIDVMTTIRAIHAVQLNGLHEDISVLQEENIELMKKLRNDDCCDCVDCAIENAEKVNKSFEVALLRKWFAL